MLLKVGSKKEVRKMWMLCGYGKGRFYDGGSKKGWGEGWMQCGSGKGEVMRVV